jgi:hypothetical protein
VTIPGGSLDPAGKWHAASTCQWAALWLHALATALTQKPRLARAGNTRGVARTLAHCGCIIRVQLPPAAPTPNLGPNLKSPIRRESRSP